VNNKMGDDVQHAGRGGGRSQDSEGDSAGSV